MHHTSVATTRPKPARRVLVIAATVLSFAASTLVGVPAASASPAPSPTLVPTPPDIYTCRTSDHGTICDALTTEAAGPDPTGLFCGSDAQAFEVVDLPYTRTVKARRWYDRNGFLVKRVREVSFSGTRYGNPLTGAFVAYHQFDVDTDIPAVPGDLATSTTYSQEYLVARDARGKAVLVDVGLAVVGPNGTLLKRTGRRDLGTYYDTGNPASIAGLCSALGA
jgi:hypothetical protein